MRYLFVFTLMIFFFGSCTTYSPLMKSEEKGVFLKKKYTFQKETLPYRILYPGVKKSQYPLLIFIHGAGERGTDNERQLIHGRKWLEENNPKYPAVVLLPQCPTEDYWSSVDRNTNAEGDRKFVFNGKAATPAMQATLALIDSMVQLPYIDKNRIYVTGLSMGGMATWEILWRRPGLVAAAAPICGGAYLEKAAEIARTNCIRIYHGAQDKVVIPEHSRSIFEALQKQGYPNVEHNAWTYVFQEVDFFEWMFSCRKE